jgi:hypothetical protein
MIVSADRCERKHLFHSQRSAGGKPAENTMCKNKRGPEIPGRASIRTDEF